MKIIYAVLIMAVVGGAFFFVLPKSETPETPKGLTTAVVRKGDLTQTVNATGSLRPRDGAEVKVGAQVSGLVKSLFVEVGSRVRKNQLLAVIDRRAYQAKVDEAGAQEEMAATQEKYAGVDYERARTLFEQAVVSKQELDAASQRLELARASLKQARAIRENAALQLAYTQILSPIDGVVSSVTTQEGETVSASLTSPTFVKIIDLDRLELWAYVDEADIGKVARGQRVTFTVDTYPGESFEGTVKTIFPDAVIQNNVVDYVVVVTIGKREGVIMRPQMDATANVYVVSKKDVPMVPKRAVQFDDGGRKFVNVPAGERMEKRYITTGISDDKNYEVVTGLAPGETVVLN